MRALKDYLQSINFNKKPDNSIIAVISQQYNNINDKDSEEQVKGQIEDMVKVFPEYETRLNDNGIDLIVKNDGQVVSIFECKSLKNKNEMLDEDDLNRKALWELIANFFLLYSEDSIPRYLVATNGKKWFVFNNRPFKGLADDRNDRASCGFGSDILFPSENREELYKRIKDFLGSKSDILKSFRENCFYFSSIEDIYFFLSPDILLNKYNPNIGNTLNRDFYDELLYIFGLKEEEKQGKKTIVPNKVANTFYSQIFNKTNDFEKSLELIIIWLNRILFLKLFEAKLVEFNGSYSLNFLKKDKIPDTVTLEMLFFDVLAVTEERRDKFAEAFENIPYLNSSLFEEKEIEKEFPISKIRGNASIKYFEKTILENEKHERESGNTTLLDYLFDFLDAYNFGEEGNPSSLISPAVLGLIFEKINGYKDGSHYTPTTITDYMAKTAIEKAILAKVKDQVKLDYNDFDDFRRQFPRFNEEERNKIKEIIRTLTVLDPAVGSGHFLVSTLNVLLQIWFDFGMIDTPIEKYEVKFEKEDIKLYKHNSSFFYKRDSKDKDDLAFQKEIFETKKFIIEKSLFGVDINPKAVEIARLRLWIELLKNAYYREDGTMETLPNIDINIKVGDSLLARTDDANTGGVFISKIVPELKKYFKDYQNISDKTAKKSIAEKINKTRKEIIELLKPSYDKLLWTIDFPQTLDEEGHFVGFDVVIGNPPYIQLQENGGKLANLYGPLGLEVFERTGDIYELFIEKVYQLLANKGILSFITSNKWMRAGYGESLRKFLRNKTTIKIIIDFCGYKVFPEATVDTNIVILSNEKPEQKIERDRIIKIDDKVKFEFLNVNEDEFVDYYNENITKYYSEKKNAMKQNELSYNAFTLADNNVLDLKKKIERIGKPLKEWDVGIYYGIKTGFNEAFIIDKNKKDEILSNCKTEEERKRTEEIIKPILRGRDIGKYYYKWAGLWLIYVPWHFPLHKDQSISGASQKAEDEFKEHFPSLYNHLSNYKEQLSNRNKDETGIRYEWYALQRWAADYYSEFEKEKIAWKAVGRNLALTIVEPGIFISAPACFSISGHNKYVLGVLSSAVIKYYILKYSDKTGAGDVMLNIQSFERLPITPITEENQPTVQQIESLVNKILPAKKQNPQTDTSKWEKEIDELVYRLYELTPEEIKIIEGESNEL